MTYIKLTIDDNEYISSIDDDIGDFENVKKKLEREGVPAAPIVIKTTNSRSFYTDQKLHYISGNIITLASYHEIQHLKQCEAAGMYVDYQEEYFPIY